jgi:hypothetical protein
MNVVNTLFCNFTSSKSNIKIKVKLPNMYIIVIKIILLNHFRVNKYD